ncbi:MAG: ABC transporter ATP-binding protein [Syntrophaceticus schinkii]|jgi:peptide/nickel transport system ATP-binding protein
MSNLLEIHNLSVTYGLNGWRVLAVRDLGLTLGEGEKLAIVGESGAGKSTIANTIMGLLGNGAEIQGEIYFKGSQVKQETVSELRGKEIVLIPQNVFNSINPVFSIGEQMEDLQNEANVAPEQRQGRILELLRRVRLPRPESIPDSFSHQLSGGMKQRVLLAMGLSQSPSLIIADEPTKGLDPIRRMGILNLLQQLVKQNRQSLMMITHDIKAAAFLCDTITLIYKGEMMERLPAAHLYENSMHPYSKALMAAAPERGLQVPSQINSEFNHSPVTGCSYAAYCQLFRNSCLEQRPALRQVAPGHWVRCDAVA